MISCLPDKFAGEVCKFVEIDFQVESKAEENLPRYETVVESEDFQVALFFTWLRDIQSIFPSLSL